jgi:hypothetical protein
MDAGRFEAAGTTTFVVVCWAATGGFGVTGPGRERI